MLDRNEDSQIRSVGETLVRRFDGRVARATVLSELESTRLAFRDSRIRIYVPVLIEREATDRLRKVARLSSQTNVA